MYDHHNDDWPFSWTVTLVCVLLTLLGVVQTLVVEFTGFEFWTMFTIICGGIGLFTIGGNIAIMIRNAIARWRNKLKKRGQEKRKLREDVSAWIQKATSRTYDDSARSIAMRELVRARKAAVDGGAMTAFMDIMCSPLESNELRAYAMECVAELDPHDVLAKGMILDISTGKSKYFGKAGRERHRLKARALDILERHYQYQGKLDPKRISIPEDLTNLP